MTPARILIAHASKHGSTREVAERVAEVMRSAGLAVDVAPAAEVGLLRGYDGVVLGGALYAGRLHKDARRFLARHRNPLCVRTVAVFAMGPQSLEAADVARSRAQLDRALKKVPEVEPVSVAIFGGVVDPAKLGFPFNRMPASDARDWTAIEAWASELAGRMSALFPGSSGRPAPPLRETTDTVSGVSRNANGATGVPLPR
jgi:menaquinone-dependent protoporphyrinogen oxidase